MSIQEHKRGRGRPPVDDPMRQISIRLPVALLREIDALIDEARDAERTDRATIIRRAIAAYVRDR